MVRIGYVPRVKGYEWALSHEPHSEYNDAESWQAFAAGCLYGTSMQNALPGDEGVQRVWEMWEQGVFDARVFLRDDSMLGTAEIAERTGFDISYIKAELKAKRLKGMKVGNSYAVYPDDFREWLNNPKRGSRSKTAE